MKTLFPVALLLVILFGSFSIVRAQIEMTITAAEFHSLRNKAEIAAGMTFPRIETVTRGGSSKYGSTTIYIFEKHGRSHQKSTGVTREGTIVRESIWYDGEFFVRNNNGPWTIPNVGGIGGEIGRGIGVSGEYTFELVKDGDKSYTLLTKSETNSLGDLSVWWLKIDSMGRLFEFREKGFGTDSVGKYEYPEKVAPIKKPKLGSNEDI